MSRSAQQLVGTLDATAALRNQQALIEVRAPRLNLASNARIETRAPYPVEFELKASDSDLSLLAVPIGPGQTLAGSIDATISGSGNLNAIKQAALTAEIRKIRLAALDREVRNQDPIKLAYRDGSTQNRSCSYRFKQRRDRNSRSRSARGASRAGFSDRQGAYGPGRTVPVHS